MADLNQIIDSRASSYPRDTDGSSVDGNIRPYPDVIFDLYGSHLRNFVVCTRAVGKTEAITPNYRTAINDNVTANPDSVSNRNMGL
jgi:hypothetical protein